MLTRQPWFKTAKNGIRVQPTNWQGLAVLMAFAILFLGAPYGLAGAPLVWALRAGDVIALLFTVYFTHEDRWR